MRQETSLINILYNHMRLRLDKLPFMGRRYLKLKPSVLKATEEIDGLDKIRGLLVTVSSSMTVNVSCNVDITTSLKNCNMYFPAGRCLISCCFKFFSKRVILVL